MLQNVNYNSCVHRMPVLNSLLIRFQNLQYSFLRALLTMSSFGDFISKNCSSSGVYAGQTGRFGPFGSLNGAKSNLIFYIHYCI